MASSKVETSRRFPLEQGGPERLELRWTASFREIRVLFDGSEVAVVARAKMPREGEVVKLPDGSALTIRMRGLLGMELRRADAHVPGSDLEPGRILGHAAILMGLAAALDGWLDGAIAQHLRSYPSEVPVPLPRDLVTSLWLDGGLAVLALATGIGSRVGLAVGRVALVLGIVAFASRFGLGGERSVWTEIYGVVTTWLLATHFFGTFSRRPKQDAPAKRRAG